MFGNEPKYDYTYETNHGPSKEEINKLYDQLLGEKCEEKFLGKILKNGYSLQRVKKHILNSNEYMEKKNTIFNFEKWTDFGMRYTYLLKDKIFIQPPINCSNNLVFIDFRYLENMEFVIRNALIRLEGKFMVTFICGLANYDEIKILCNEISKNIHVLKLEKHINSQNDYNNLLLEINFWENLEGEYILIHQFDAFIFKEWNDDFCESNYLGSPCYFDEKELIINGGFSFRKKEKMISLLKEHNPSNIFEDMFFSRSLNVNKGLCEKFSFQEKDFDAFGGHQFWKAKNYSFGEMYDKLLRKKSTIHKYSNLFHKFVLGLRNPHDPIKYEIKQYYFEQKDLVAHLHCYDIQNFDEFYGYKIDEIVKCYFTIVTFSKGNYKGNIENVVVLKHENRGADIGGKFVCIKYLKDIKYDYTNILMLHSKKDPLKRKIYYDPYLNNMEEMIKKIDSNYGCYTPQLIYSPSKEVLFPGKEVYPVKKINKVDWQRNSKYMNDVLEYMNIPNFSGVFPEGNVYILSKDVAEFIYTDLKLYNSLNSVNSFDYSWVCNYYNKNFTIQKCYNEVKEKKLYCNNFNTSLGWKGLADCMIEHIFERIIFGVCIKLNRKVNILDSGVNEDFNNFLYDKSISIPVKPVCIIACHTNSEIKLKSLVNNIKYLSKLSDKIFIVNSKEYEGKIENYLDDKKFIINDNLSNNDAKIYLDTYPDLKSHNLTIMNAKEHWKKNGKSENRFIRGRKLIYTEYIENDLLVCQGKWNSSLLKKDKNYPFILTNDSFFITRDLDDFEKLYNSSGIDMVSIVDSNEGKKHHMDFLRYYSSNVINKLIEFYNQNFKICNNFFDVVQKLEIESTYITENRKSLYRIEKNYKKNLHFDDEVYEKYLENGYPIVKIKKLLFNKYKNFPRDFKANEYKQLHIDLTHMEDSEAELHFINHGFSEGRPYKKNQSILLPKYIESYITSLGLNRIH